MELQRDTRGQVCVGKLVTTLEDVVTATETDKAITRPTVLLTGKQGLVDHGDRDQTDLQEADPSKAILRTAIKMTKTTKGSYKAPLF